MKRMMLPTALRGPLALPTPRCQQGRTRRSVMSPLAPRRPLAPPKLRRQLWRHGILVVTSLATDAELHRAALATPMQAELSSVRLTVIMRFLFSRRLEATDVVGRRVYLTWLERIEMALTARICILRYMALTIAAYGHASAHRVAELRMRKITVTSRASSPILVRRRRSISQGTAAVSSF